MPDHGKMEAAFKAGIKMKINGKLKPKSGWAKKVISDLEKDSKKTYGEYERPCNQVEFPVSSIESCREYERPGGQIEFPVSPIESRREHERLCGGK